MKKFKTESKKVLDLMINSIYTNKEIFLRELISNASDAIDKLYYKSLQSGNTGLSREDFYIKIELDKKNRTITISDNGIGMNEASLEENLGTIAKSGSLDFKENLKEEKDINIIGQFGVGFYSAFMVASSVEVISKAYGEDKAYKWVSEGIDGYEITEAEKESNGTDIILHIKDNTENENYDRFLEDYAVKALVKKYSDYIRYKILMEDKKTVKNEKGEEESTVEFNTVNTMIPLWKKNKKDIKEEEYNEFYKNMFYDNEEPMKYLHLSMEGLAEYKALLFIPKNIPYDYYTKDYEKGLSLYTNGVLITEKCKDLLPDYFNFVKGVVDTDLPLNISRETLQDSHQIKVIANSIENKIKDELLLMQKNSREEYLKFFKSFGMQLKFGVYQNWGLNRDRLQDLLVYYSIKQDKFITLKEYKETMLENQKYIYYATGKTVDSVKSMPQVEPVLEANYDVLCMTDDIDEFAVKVLREYEEKEFKNVCEEDIGIEKQEENQENKELADYLSNLLVDRVVKVKLSNKLKSFPVCLTSEGELSIEMEKVINANPNGQKVCAKKVLEINTEHPIYEKINKYYNEDKEKLADLMRILFVQAQLIAGLEVDNAGEYANLVCKFIN